MDDDRDVRTETQREWADWSAHGYPKRYQPRSLLRFGFAFFTLFAALLVAVVYLAAHGGLP